MKIKHDEKKIEELKILLQKQGLDLEDKGDDSEWGSIQIWQELEVFMKQYAEHLVKQEQDRIVEMIEDRIDNSYWNINFGTKSRLRTTIISLIKNKDE